MILFSLKFLLGHKTVWIVIVALVAITIIIVVIIISSSISIVVVVIGSGRTDNKCTFAFLFYNL